MLQPIRNQNDRIGP